MKTEPNYTFFNIDFARKSTQNLHACKYSEYLEYENAHRRTIIIYIWMFEHTIDMIGYKWGDLFIYQGKYPSMIVMYFETSVFIIINYYY